MKRASLAIVVLIALISLLIAGCGGDEADEPTAQPTAGPTATVGATGTPAKTAAPTQAPPSGELGQIISKASSIDSITYDMVMTGPGMPAMTIKSWLKNSARKMKAESKAQGMTTVQLVDWNAGEAYMYMPDQNMAYKIELTDAPESPVEGMETVEQYNPTVLGTETYDGKECLVVEWTDEGISTKLWIWKQYGFPVKAETTTPEGKTTIEYKNISFSNIPDSVFQLPPGVQIIEL